MASGIYQIRNTLNGKCYIGSAVNLQRRYGDHLRRLRRGQHPNHHLQAAFNKYGQGTFVFEVLEEVEPEKLTEREQFYLDTIKPEYNILPTAGSTLGFRYTEESKQKMRTAKIGKYPSMEAKQRMSVARTGERNPMYDKHHSAATRRKMRGAWTAKRREAQRKRMMILNIDKPGSMARKGRHHSEKTRRKISVTLKAYWRRIRAEKEKDE